MTQVVFTAGSGYSSPPCIKYRPIQRHERVIPFHQPAPGFGWGFSLEFTFFPAVQLEIRAYWSCCCQRVLRPASRMIAPLKTHQNNRSYPLIHRPSAKASYNPQRFQNRQLLLRKCQCLFRQFCHVFLGSIQCLAILDDFLPLSLQQLPNKLRPFDGVFLALIL